MTWSTFAADVPRFVLPSNYLLIEGQRTNLIRNPRMEGAVAGAPGTAPSLTSMGVPPAGTRQIVGLGTENGLPYLEVEFVFIAAGVVEWFLDSALIPATAFAPFTTSIFVRAITNTAGAVCKIFYEERNAGGVQQTGVYAASFAPTSTLTRYSGTATMVATVTQNGVGLQIVTASAGTVRLRIAVPQAENAAFASTPILPPVGTPGASTRGADLVSATLASLGIGANGACTILWSGALPQAAPSGAPQWIAQVDDGTDLNRFYVRNNGGGAVVTAGRALAAAGADAASAGTMTPGAPFSLGLSIDGSGRLASCMNGGVVQVVSGGPSSGLTTLRLGINASGGDAMFGETREFIVIPYALSDANLAARVAALPL